MFSIISFAVKTSFKGPVYTVRKIVSIRVKSSFILLKKFGTPCVPTLRRTNYRCQKHTFEESNTCFFSLLYYLNFLKAKKLPLLKYTVPVAYCKTLFFVLGFFVLSSWQHLQESILSQILLDYC